MRRNTIAILCTLALSISPAGIVVLVGAAPALAEDVWVRGRGHADVVGDVTQEQAKAKAMRRAQTEALRKAFGTEFRNTSFLRIFNGGVIVDGEMLESTAGIILETKPPDWSQETIAAGRDEPPFTRLGVSADFRIAPLPRANSRLAVDFDLNKRTLVSGDPLTLNVRASDRAYLTVFNLGGDDKVYLLYPNKFRTEIVVDRGQELQLPGPEDPFELRPRTVAGHPLDQEIVRIVATVKPIAPPETDEDRVVSPLAYLRWLKGLPRTEWTDAEDHYTVHSAH